LKYSAAYFLKITAEASAELSEDSISYRKCKFGS